MMESGEYHLSFSLVHLDVVSFSLSLFFVITHLLLAPRFSRRL